MYSNPFVAQQVATECIRDAMRQAEQARLVRVAAGSRKPWNWRLPMIMALKNMRAPVVRPQLKRHIKA